MRQFKKNTSFFHWVDKSNDGFTLLEVIISFTILLVILAGLSGVAASNRKLYKNAKTIGETTQSITYAMYVIKREIRNANSVDIDTTGSQRKLFIKDASNNDKMQFMWQKGQGVVKLKQGAGGFDIFVEGIKEANFVTNSDKTLITITLTGTDKDKDGKDIDVTLTSYASPRNRN
jgi:prepilin-type N-terminal cleavage/methylation domain-containing protein